MDIKETIRRTRDEHANGYASRVDDDDQRDLLNEAGRIARGTCAMIGGTSHILALVDILGGTLRDVVEALDDARSSSAEHATISAHARAVLQRLEIVGEAEEAWIELMATRHLRTPEGKR